MLVIILVLVWLFWVYFDTEVRDAVRWIRYSEMWLISWFVESDYKFIHSGQKFSFSEAMELTRTLDREKLQYSDLSLFNSASMGILRKVMAGILGAGALWCMFIGPGTKYRRSLTLESLIETQARNFPVISPFVKFNPAMQPSRPPGTPVPADLPLFAEALGPEEWLAYIGVTTKDATINEGVVEQAFVDQLGSRWRGADALVDYKKILLASFCLKASRKRADADEMLGRIARCWSADRGLDLGRDRALLREAKAVLGDKALAGKTLAVANQHAFESTALLRALAFAREEGGVLAPAQFVWLRGHDRGLWYPLNNMGRHSFHMEALGAMAHYKAEKVTQRPIPVPKVGDAVKTIIDYMKSIKARPIPEMDYSKSKKRGVKKAV